MTIAPVDLAHATGPTGPALTDRAYLVLVARWRRARPRRDFGAWADDAILAALADAVRPSAWLACSSCETITAHAHVADEADELSGQVARIWRCGCGALRQFGAVELSGEPAADEDVAA